MKLEVFAQAGLIVRVHSDLLGCDVLFVSDNVSDEALRSHDLPVYRSAELKKLFWLSPNSRDLRRVHMVKEIFRGTVIGVGSVNDE